MKLLLSILFLIGAANALAPFFEASSEGVSGRYIVVLKDDSNVESVIGRLTQDASSAGLSATIKQRYESALNGFAVQIDGESKGLQLLRSLPGVDYIEQDAIRRAFTGCWGQDRIDQKPLPLDGRMDLAAGDGSGAHIYVIDTGINPNHNDFGRRAKSVYSTIPNESMDDENGHGTHCAGTTGSATYGVATNANIYGVKVLNKRGSGYVSDSIKGMDWVIANHKRPAVMSMSLGGGPSASEDAAVTRATNAGIVVVVAAGNDNRDACNYSPARSSDAITVGATKISGDLVGDGEDQRSSFSNYGRCVDIFAPGSNIKSLSHRSNTGTKTMSGTSMACPYVAGIAAVIRGKNPTYGVTMVRRTILDSATYGKISNVGTGSPNKLAYCD